jgi:hypothetical protein
MGTVDADYHGAEGGVRPAADHDRRAGGVGRDMDADGAVAEVGDTAAAAVGHHDEFGVAGRCEQGGRRVAGHRFTSRRDVRGDGPGVGHGGVDQGADRAAVARPAFGVRQNRQLGVA